jgi:hypothetical protein
LLKSQDAISFIDFSLDQSLPEEKLNLIAALIKKDNAAS